MGVRFLQAESRDRGRPPSCGLTLHARSSPLLRTRAMTEVRARVRSCEARLLRREIKVGREGKIRGVCDAGHRRGGEVVVFSHIALSHSRASRRI